MFNTLALLDVGMGRLAVFMGIPFLIGFIIIASSLISKCIKILKKEINGSTDDSGDSNVVAENKENE